MKLRASALIVAIVLIFLAFNPLNTSAATTVAVLKEVNGEVVLIKGGGKQEFIAFNGMQVQQGDSIRTGKSSSVKIDFGEDQATLGEYGKVTLAEYSSFDSENEFTILSTYSGKNVTVKQESGGLWSKVKRVFGAGNSHKVETSTAIMGVRGTLFLTFMDRNNNESVSVLDGVIGVERARGTRFSGVNEPRVTPGLELTLSGQAPLQSASINYQELFNKVDAVLATEIVVDVVEAAEERAAEAEKEADELERTKDKEQAKKALELAARAELMANVADQAVRGASQSNKSSKINTRLQQQRQQVLAQMQARAEEARRKNEEIKQRMELLATQAGLTQQEQRQVTEPIRRQIETVQSQPVTSAPSSGGDGGGDTPTAPSTPTQNKLLVLSGVPEEELLEIDTDRNLYIHHSGYSIYKINGNFDDKNGEIKYIWVRSNANSILDSSVYLQGGHYFTPDYLNMIYPVTLDEEVDSIESYISIIYLDKDYNPVAYQEEQRILNKADVKYNADTALELTQVESYIKIDGDSLRYIFHTDSNVKYMSTHYSILEINLIDIMTRNNNAYNSDIITTSQGWSNTLSSLLSRLNLEESDYLYTMIVFYDEEFNVIYFGKRHFPLEELTGGGDLPDEPGDDETPGGNVFPTERLVNGNSYSIYYNADASLDENVYDVTLFWNDVEGAIGYRVYDDPSFPDQDFYPISPGTREFQIQLSDEEFNSDMNFYIVAVYDIDGTEAISDALEITVIKGPIVTSWYYESDGFIVIEFANQEIDINTIDVESICFNDGEHCLTTEYSFVGQSEVNQGEIGFDINNGKTILYIGLIDEDKTAIVKDYDHYLIVEMVLKKNWLINSPYHSSEYFELK